jgi:hypothetical protein
VTPSAAVAGWQSVNRDQPLVHVCQLRFAGHQVSMSLIEVVFTNKRTAWTVASAQSGRRTDQPYPTLRILPWLAVAACLLCAGLSGCGSSGTGSFSPPNPARNHATSLSTAFPILRSPGEPLSRQMRIRMKVGRDVTLRAHRADTVDGPIWLVVSNHGRTCLFAGRPPASVCEPTNLALRHGLTLGVVEAPSEPSRRHFVLYGVIPKQKPTIRVRIGEHRIEAIRVRRGAFSLRAREPVVKL